VREGAILTLADISENGVEEAIFSHSQLKTGTAFDVAD
jgi:hypothetical protein